LTTIGERRQRAKSSERCYVEPMRLRMASGAECVDDDGQPIVVQFAVPPGSRPRCNCVFTAIASDALAAYLADRDPLSIRPTTTYVAQRIHEHADWSIETAVEKWKSRDEQRTLAKLERLDPSATGEPSPVAGVRSRTPAQPELKGSKPAPQPSKRPDKRPVQRSRRWFDHDQDDLLSKQF
jgi:hypothetical protein